MPYLLPYPSLLPYPKNRDRILHTDIAVMFLRAICAQAEKAGLLSDDHFTVDGTLIESWASLKSFRPKDQEPPQSTKGGRNPEVDFHGEKRINDTHVSITDPEARLFRKGKGKEARLSFMGHVLMENRNGLVVDSRLTLATGTAEREAAISMAAEIPGDRCGQGIRHQGFRHGPAEIVRHPACRPAGQRLGN